MAKYEYVKSKDNTFVNPYNFIPVSKNMPAAKNAEDLYSKTDDLLRGYIECSLITKTPISIPDVSRAEDMGSKHMYYPFYSYDGTTPVIAGSSIRGVIRSVYETVTNSCYSTSHKEEPISDRTDAANAFKECVLIKQKDDEHWKLYLAEKYLIRIDDPGYGKSNISTLSYGVVVDESNKRCISTSSGKKYSSGDSVVFNYFSRGEGNRKRNFVYDIADDENSLSSPGDTEYNKKTGYVFAGEDNSQLKNGSRIPGSKKYERILVPSNTALVENADSWVNDLDKIVDDFYSNDSINKSLGDGHTGYANYSYAKGKGIILAWCSLREDRKTVDMVSVAAVGRKLMKRKMGDLLSRWKSCGETAIGSARKSLCPACMLFGVAAKNGSLGSRVRFTDAVAVGYDGSNTIRKVTLKELGGPHATYYPFYTTNNMPFDNGGAIRGRKFYWHNPAAISDSSVYSTNEKTNRNATHDLIPTGTEFRFKIYFDGINRAQRDQLIWAVNLGVNSENSGLCHKIGHGKPLGLGSVKICVRGCYVRDVKDGYQMNSWEIPESVNVSAFKAEEGYSFLTDDTVQNVMKICDFSLLEGSDIRYPYIVCDDEPNASENDIASHQWFTHNRGNSKEEKKETQQLPNIFDDVQELYAFKIQKSE